MSGRKYKTLANTGDNITSGDVIQWRHMMSQGDVMTSYWCLDIIWWQNDVMTSNNEVSLWCDVRLSGDVLGLHVGDSTFQNSHVKSLWPMMWLHVMPQYDVMTSHNGFVCVSQSITKKDFGAKGLYNLGNAGGTWTLRRFHSLIIMFRKKRCLLTRRSQNLLRGAVFSEKG